LLVVAVVVLKHTGALTVLRDRFHRRS
jgi:hypothetical protein